MGVPSSTSGARAGRRCRPRYDAAADASSGSALTLMTGGAPRTVDTRCDRCHGGSRRPDGSALTLRPGGPRSRAGHPSGVPQDGRRAVVHTRNSRRARLATGALMALTLTMTAAACGGDSDGATTDGRQDQADRRDLQRVRLRGAHRGVQRDAGRGRGGAEEGRHGQRAPGQPLHQAGRRLRPLRHRGHRGRLVAGPDGGVRRVRRPLRPRGRGPLAGLEDRGRDHRRRRAHRLRHRHRPGGHLLPRRPVQEGRDAHRPRRGRRALRRAGTTTSTPVASSSRRSPTPPGTTPRAAPRRR